MTQVISENKTEKKKNKKRTTTAVISLKTELKILSNFRGQYPNSQAQWNRSLHNSVKEEFSFDSAKWTGLAHSIIELRKISHIYLKPKISKKFSEKFFWLPQTRNFGTLYKKNLE